MAACPLCSERPAKRYCPAKGDQICAVCCGTKREVEIYCPGDCSHLLAARSYEAEKQIPDAELAALGARFSREFLYKFSPVLDAIGIAVLSERMQSEWLVDHDVIEVYKALAVTMKTLSSGIHYESLPEGAVQQALFRRLKDLLETTMQPQENVDRRALTVSEAIEVLEFLRFVAQANSIARPKSCRYLDWLASMLSPAKDETGSSGLILP